MRAFAAAVIRLVALCTVIYGLLESLMPFLFLYGSYSAFEFVLLPLTALPSLAVCLGIFLAAPRLAAWIAPDEPLPTPFPDQRTLFGLGLVLIGLLLALGGVSSLSVVLPQTMAAIAEMSRNHGATFAIDAYWQALAPPALKVVFGTALILWGRRHSATAPKPAAAEGG